MTAPGAIACSPASSRSRNASMCAASAARLTARRGSGGAEGGDPGDIFGAGAQAALLPAAADQRIGEDEYPRLRAPARRRPSARRSCGPTASADRRQARRCRTRMRPGRLHGIDVEQAARRMDDRGGLRDRLHDAGLVIGEHERNQRPRRFGDGRRPSAARSSRPSRIDRDSSIASRAKRPPARTETCSIAESRSSSRGRFSPATLDRRRQRQHIGFGAARGEKHVARPRADQRRHLLARLLDRRRAARPSAWTEEGLPGSASAAANAARASGRNGAVAFQSK